MQRTLTTLLGILVLFSIAFADHGPPPAKRFRSRLLEP